MSEDERWDIRLATFTDDQQALAWAAKCHASMEADRDAWKARAEEYRREREEERDRVEHVTKQRDALRAALERYGRHVGRCESIAEPLGICDCGLSEALGNGGGT